MLKRNICFFGSICILILAITISFIGIDDRAVAANVEAKYIKWAEFDVPSSALEKAYSLQMSALKKEKEVNWIDLLAYVGTKYGGNWKKYKSKDLDSIYSEVMNGKSIEELTVDMKYFSYYKEIYDAVLNQFVGEYKIEKQREGNEVSDPNAQPELETKFGIKAYSPVAYGYSFSHYDDFGNSRSFGFKRKHLGNDLIGSVGTPIVAVESGIVECMGWNKYGGWRVGIRSFDKKRYYYYAHLRKGHPFNKSLKEGDVVQAGDVVGYLGMTGYSDQEDYNGMKVPHLHFGMQLIFDESQKEGNSEIWINVYEIVKFLQKHKSPVIKNEETKDYFRKYKFEDPIVNQHSQPQTPS